MADEYATPYHISIRPSLEFSYEAARNKLVSINIGESDGSDLVIQTPGDMHDISAEQQRRGNFLRLAGWINVESRVTVGCAGAVLAYLKRQQAAALSASEDITVAIIEMWSLSDVMSVVNQQ
jgi:DNA mismatch repair protein MSH5